LSRLVTVSAKIPEKLRRRMYELGIEPSKVIRRALEEEVRRREWELLKERGEAMRHILEKLSVERAVKSIWGDREGR